MIFWLISISQYRYNYIAWAYLAKARYAFIRDRECRKLSSDLEAMHSSQPHLQYNIRIMLTRKMKYEMTLHTHCDHNIMPILYTKVPNDCCYVYDIKAYVN